jgi:hypothetical protein
MVSIRNSNSNSNSYLVSNHNMAVTLAQLLQQVILEGNNCSSNNINNNSNNR